ncbi:phage portal protein [Oceanobacillus sp. J11TS1]|uniref:phage portal protein n=1 Tax=Oceanobacillus sp. J11TS1 TaxID=2807191 RepID=UPI001B25CD63|nr:phage portal protein [Oceanobacillus sp. J11TS1]GIO25174.1 putative minor capsid protein, phage associated [Oceanobacillus sp. J11TS1]
MNFIDRIKNLFKRGGYALSGQRLKTINDHPKINIDPAELERIERSLRHYQYKYPEVEYVNSNGEKKKRPYMALNMKKKTAKRMSTLVFNENCQIVVSDDKDETGDNHYAEANEFIQHVFEHNTFKKNLREYLEPMYALGGLAIRPYVNQESEEIEFSWAIANAFYPLRSNSNGISEGVMVFKTTKMERDKEVYYTLFEFHEWEGDMYIITNELYKTTEKGEIGSRVPLGELYEDLQEVTYLKGLTQTNFQYLKPAGFNNISPHSPLGLGITDNSESTIKKINEASDQYWWEIKMGQRTVFVSDHMLSTLPSEDGMPPQQVFDPDVNIFKSMRADSDQELVKDVTRDIRTDQYIAAINSQLRELEDDLGLSVGTFSFDGKSVKTATEVSSENSLTYQTRNDYVNDLERFIKGLVVSVLELAKASGLFKGEIPTFEHIGVDFDDGIFQNKEQLLRHYGQAKTFGIIPTVEVIKRVFNLPTETAKEWLKQIQEEQLAIEPSEIADRAARGVFGDEE